MNYYKLETVKQVLCKRYDATSVSVGEPRGEAWERVASGHTYLALLGWDRDERVVSGFDVLYVASALHIDGEELTARIRAAGGLWLGPSPG